MESATLTKTIRRNYVANALIPKSLVEIEAAWEEMQNVHIEITAEEFEKRLLKMAKRYGTLYSQEKGKWLDVAKKAISDPAVPQKEKNLYFAEINPPELKKAQRKFNNAFTKLHGAVEWAYKDINDFINDTTKDELLRAFLRWRVLPVAEALYRLNLQGEITQKEFLRLRPVVSIS